ncbi:MAG: ImmA/IrrE family metallo-endopeptidase [Phycisphaerales bacterium]|nr:ImmA/IrrE family metallo-endopeptidase [Phycisphaerales bacterium]
MSHPPLLLQVEPRARKIEQRASDCLERCCESLGLKRAPLPIPVDRWIECPLGIRFGITDLSYISPDVLGAASPSDNEILISESVLSNEARFRFTCAHELGHMLLHKGKRRLFRDTQERPLPDVNLLERQADRFAAAFLMPVSLLVRELVNTCDEQGVTHKEGIAELMLDTPESDWLWKKVFLPTLTRRFGMSLQATIFRFRELRRFDGRSFLFERSLDRLLQSAKADGRKESFRLIDGFPRRPLRGLLFE